MALKPCRECKRKVSTDAVACPQCGAVDPTGRPLKPGKPGAPAKKTSSGWLIISFFGLCILFFSIGECGKHDTATTPASPSQVGASQTPSPSPASTTAPAIQASPPSGSVAEHNQVQPGNTQADAGLPQLALPMPLAKYKLLGRKIDKAPSKVQIDAFYKVEPTITRGQLDALMAHIYAEMTQSCTVIKKDKRSGLEDAPCAIYAYFYVDETAYLSDLGRAAHVASILKHAADSAPALRNTIIEGGLRSQIRGVYELTGDLADSGPFVVDEQNSRVTQLLIHDGAASDGYASTAWDVVFSAMETLLRRVPSVTVVQIQYEIDGKIMIDVKVSRKDWERMGYYLAYEKLANAEADIMNQAADGKVSIAKADEKIAAGVRLYHRRLLSAIPAGNRVVAKNVLP